MNAQPAPAFVLFGAGHLVTLALIAALSVAVSRIAPRTRNGALAWGMAALLLAQEAFKLYLFLSDESQPWQRSLPLDLCRVNAFLCAAMLVARSYRLFEVAYFWAMAGSVSAMLTPALTEGFPGVLFVLFFFGHGLAVLAVLYAIFGFGFWPRLRSVGIALAVTGVYAAVITPLNYVLDTNYLFLRAKPEATTALDLLGPWPAYLIGLVLVAIVACCLCYAPFALARRWRLGDGAAAP